MESGGVARRVSYIFLCLLPLLSIPLAGIRDARIPGVYQSLGAVLFAAIAVAAWVLGARRIGSGVDGARGLALAGVFLIAPFAIISLLWVGLGTPWDATPVENRMRYLVLLADSIAVTCGFFFLKESLSDAGERFYSTLGFATGILAGAAYVIWNSFQVGAYVVAVREGQVSPTIVSLSDMFDILLFVACVLTYAATAAFAAALGKVHWLGRGVARAYAIVALVALGFLVTRGLSFPDPKADATPWYLRPGFIAGIPAIPWVMPFLLGVISLRRAGNDQR